MKRPIIGVTSFSLSSPVPRSGINQSYVNAIVAAGGAPIGIPLGLDDPSLDAIYSALDGLLLPGGGDVAPDRYGQEPHPTLNGIDTMRDDLEIALVRRAIADDLPLLGICRGIQVLAVAG